MRLYHSIPILVDEFSVNSAAVATGASGLGQITVSFLLSLLSNGNPVSDDTLIVGYAQA